jgi:hypothetical protein
MVSKVSTFDPKGSNLLKWESINVCHRSVIVFFFQWLFSHFDYSFASADYLIVLGTLTSFKLNIRTRYSRWQTKAHIINTRLYILTFLLICKLFFGSHIYHRTCRYFTDYFNHNSHTTDLCSLLYFVRMSKFSKNHNENTLRLNERRFAVFITDPTPVLFSSLDS